MRAAFYVLSVGAVLGGCSDPPCAPGERKVGSVCVMLDEADALVDGGTAGVPTSPTSEGPGQHAGASGDGGGRPARESDLDPQRDSGMNTAGGGPDAGLPGVAVDGASACSVPGHCPSWPMPDALGKFPPAFARDGDVVRDLVTGLMWQARVSFRGPYDIGATYCDDLSLAGEDDWRLPTVIEIISIFGASLSPALDVNGFPDEMLDQDIWAAKVQSGGEDIAYSVVTGGLGSVLKWNLREWTNLIFSARCVRGGHLPSGPRYVIDEREGTVQDNWTRLVWKRAQEDGTFSREGASRRCEALGEGWRLPTAKELVTLVDPLAQNPATDLKAFPDTVASSYWTKTVSSRLRDGKLELFNRVIFFAEDDNFSNYSFGAVPDPQALLRVRCVR
jgi:hypothetical protein